FVTRRFKRAWADEISVGFARQPVTVYVALRGGRLVGFAAYECTRKDFFGPTGVVEEERGRGLGRALLLACLWALRESGYAYAIVGGVGPARFYERAVGATLIPDSSPGVYADPISAGDTPE
ncbi:MAG TPA: GNAT family N-acetyltransferase, partial [Pyrinomonadaceae bacterium]|nr:GNAT family N-acetyltransferase [Pyrinomonadaceae bacterium]